MNRITKLNSISCCGLCDKEGIRISVSSSGIKSPYSSSIEDAGTRGETRQVIQSEGRFALTNRKAVTVGPKLSLPSIVHHTKSNLHISLIPACSFTLYNMVFIPSDIVLLIIDCITLRSDLKAVKPRGHTASSCYGVFTIEII
jgi:hypothetical protein